MLVVFVVDTRHAEGAGGAGEVPGTNPSGHAASTDVVSDDPALTLPHPRAHERGFVLVPWADVDPDAVLRHGDHTVAVRELAAASGAGVRRRTAQPEEGVR